MGKLKIQLLGADFAINSPENNEYLEKLLRHYINVTEDVKKIDRRMPSLHVAILSGIEMCNELYKEKEKRIALESGRAPQNIPQDSSEIEKRTQGMIETISKVL